MSDPKFWSDLRPEVQTFALLMEKKLRANDEAKGRTGWKTAPPRAMFDVLDQELSELSYARDSVENDLFENDPVDPENLADFVDEIVDVANVGMMCIDVLKGLPAAGAPAEPHPSIKQCLDAWRKGQPGEEHGHDMNAVRRALAFCVDSLTK